LPGTSEPAQQSHAAPEVSAPEPDDLASLQGDATQTAAQPDTGAADGALEAPADGAGEAGVRVDTEEPVLPSPQSQAPEAPESEEDLSISTDPAQPALPDVSVADAAAFPTEEKTGDASQADMTQAEADTPQDDTTGQTGEVDTQSTAEQEVQPEAEAADADVAESAEAEPQTDAADAEPAQQSAGTVEETDAGASSVIGDLAPEVKTNRLPSVGDEAGAEAEPDADGTADADAAADVAASDAQEAQPPLVKYAEAFDNPEGKPLMSIILIDDGSSPVGLQALESFPYPLTFAVAANWDGAEDAMAKYRAAGFEVLALTDLPEGAGPQDAEQAMQAVFSVIPEAVGIMEGTGSGLQSSREAAEQLAPILLESGRGVVLFPKGLNTAQKLLAREGVPSAAVFRDFDAKGQNATVIRRFLDQAAFKAGQEGAGVVMVGRLRPDTVSALLLWGLQDRANRVALSPISALLQGGE
jgi:polysaccharide deacetylase 2 family uncharacterized protein YibQ